MTLRNFLGYTEMMFQKKTIKVNIAISYIVLAIAIMLMPIVLIPKGSRSDYFWLRILWTEFLAFLVWCYFGGFFSIFLSKDQDSRRIGEIYPSLGIIVLVYAVVSFLLMILSISFEGNQTLNRIHISAQILITAIALITYVSLYLAIPTAESDAEPIPKGIKKPDELSALLFKNEERLRSTFTSGTSSDDIRNLFEAIKSLREKIKYSLQHVGAIGQSEEYLQFTEEVLDLNARLSSLEYSGEENVKEIENTFNLTNSLLREVGLIINSLKKV